MTGETARAAVRILGSDYPHSFVTYWRVNDKTAWLLTARGKSHPMTAGFVVAGGRLITCVVLEARDQHVGAVRSISFLNQFEGASLDKNKKLDRPVDGITGATVSANALKNMARLALALEAISEK